MDGWFGGNGRNKKVYRQSLERWTSLVLCCAGPACGRPRHVVMNDESPHAYLDSTVWMELHRPLLGKNATGSCTAHWTDRHTVINKAEPVVALKKKEPVVETVVK